LSRLHQATSLSYPPAAVADHSIGPTSAGQGTAEQAPFGEGVIDREEVRTRYRRLRAVSRAHNNAVLQAVPKKVLIHWGKRLGLVRRKTFIFEGEEELSLLADLAVYSARPGKAAPVERYRKTKSYAAGSTEAVMLDAMCDWRFSLFVVRRPHRTAGLVLYDLFRQEDVWLMDEGLEKTAPAGMALASRVTKPDAFHMTTGAALPLGEADLEETAALFSDGGANPFVDGGRNVKFVETVYRAAVTHSLLTGIRYE